jgi:hypothetical protein
MGPFKIRVDANKMVATFVRLPAGTHTILELPKTSLSLSKTCMSISRIYIYIYPC